MPDEHSKLVPPLPIPNRTVKRLRADDSAATSVKVGHRQAVIEKNPRRETGGGFLLGAPCAWACPMDCGDRRGRVGTRPNNHALQCLSGLLIRQSHRTHPANTWPFALT